MKEELSSLIEKADKKKTSLMKELEMLQKEEEQIHNNKLQK